LLNFFRAASPLKSETPVKSSKPPAVKAKLEARVKQSPNPTTLSSKQERAARNRSDLLSKLFFRL